MGIERIHLDRLVTSQNVQFALIIKRQENVSLSREVTFVYVIRRNQKEKEIAGMHPQAP